VLSLGFTLQPGDVIATGTPEGVGAALSKLLKAGDRMEAEVERIGVLANRVGGAGLAASRRGVPACRRVRGLYRVTWWSLNGTCRA
jgi:hypothetical protein